MYVAKYSPVEDKINYSLGGKPDLLPRGKYHKGVR